jgi:carbon-monoxide dehydrogenase iron sulfur subunit
MHIEVDLSKCIYCKTCELVCSFVKTGEFNPANSLIKVFRDGVSDIGYHVCKQCKDPKCAKACKYSALERKGKIVTLNRKRCIDCGKCYIACPYHAIWRVQDKAMKCDVCLACVRHCPRHAIKVVFDDPKS